MGSIVTELVLPTPALPVPSLPTQAAGAVVPAIVAGAGERAARRFPEFFAATIRNANTRAAYHRAVVRFFAWCEAHGLDELALIEPLHVAAYVEQLGRSFEKPTVKQHLAAVRMLFDWLAADGILAEGSRALRRSVRRAPATSGRHPQAGPRTAARAPATRADRLRQALHLSQSRARQPGPILEAAC